MITGNKRGKRQHLGSNHHLLQLTSQRPNHRRPTGGRKLYLDYSGFQGCSDCREKSCSNPSTTRGGSGGGRLEFFLSRLILSLMDLLYILSSRWLTIVEQKTQSLTQGTSRILSPVSLISRNILLTPRLIVLLCQTHIFVFVLHLNQTNLRFVRSSWPHQKMLRVSSLFSLAIFASSVLWK